MIANGLAFLIGAAVNWLTYRIEQAELATREKLLQIELRIAELCEAKQLDSTNSNESPSHSFFFE